MKSLKSFIKFKRTTLFLIPVVLGCFGLSPLARAVLPSPTPDGGYPGGNTAEGQNALFNLTTGTNNTAVGWLSLETVTVGQLNTAIGSGTLSANTGNLNTATGGGVLFSNTIGAQNSASGALALFHNTTGSNNTANGFEALFSNLDGHDNTANGDYALVSNDHGNYNTADGNAALFANQSGNQNTALGRNAGSNITTGSGNIDIGAFVSGIGVETNTIRIGDNLPNTLNGSFCYIGGIYGQQTSLSGMAVFVDSTNKLGYQVSSRRFKHDIKVTDKASEAILALKPVTFHYNSDKTNTPCFGLIAEEVAAVNQNLIVRDNKGEPLTVRYEAVNAMLLNEFLKEHRKVEKLEATIAHQQKGLEILGAQIQRVSAQVRMDKPATRVVLNNP
jgi:hypothetical protein